MNNTLKIKWRKPRRTDDIRKRRDGDGTSVSAQDGTFIKFDAGDFETLVAPLSPYLICNKSGDGKTHVRIRASRETGKKANNIQVSHLVLGLLPGDGREVRFANFDPRDMRKANLFTVGKPRNLGNVDEGGSGAQALAA